MYAIRSYYVNAQNSQDCVKYYERSIELNNRFYLSYNGLGNFYLKSNNFVKAELSYTKAIEINPKRSAKIYKNRAYIREKLGKIQQAKEDLKNRITSYNVCYTKLLRLFT